MLSTEAILQSWPRQWDDLGGRLKWEDGAKVEMKTQEGGQKLKY